MSAEPFIYRIMHKESKSIALLSFSCKDKVVKLETLQFIQGNVLDLDSYRAYKKHAAKAIA